MAESQNSFAGGLFSLSASDSGNDLFLNFEASAVPEPEQLSNLVL